MKHLLLMILGSTFLCACSASTANSSDKVSDASSAEKSQAITLDSRFSDLSFFDLKGKVKSAFYPEDNDDLEGPGISYGFDENGNGNPDNFVPDYLIRGFDAEMTNGYAYYDTKLIREDNGLVSSIAAFDPETEEELYVAKLIYDDSQKVIQMTIDRPYFFDGIFDITRNSDGNISEIKITYMGNGTENVENIKCEYLSFDDHGNWTKRHMTSHSYTKVTIGDNEEISDNDDDDRSFDEVRVITYY